jgi:hypothetical protein
MRGTGIVAVISLIRLSTSARLRLREAWRREPAAVGIVGALLAFAAFGRKGFDTSTFETIMVTPGVLTLRFGVAALIVETSWALLVPMMAGLMLLWALALMHDAGYLAPRHAAGHA